MEHNKQPKVQELLFFLGNFGFLTYRKPTGADDDREVHPGQQRIEQTLRDHQRSGGHEHRGAFRDHRELRGERPDR